MHRLQSYKWYTDKIRHPHKMHDHSKRKVNSVDFWLKWVKRRIHRTGWYLNRFNSQQSLLGPKNNKILELKLLRLINPVNSSSLKIFSEVSSWPSACLMLKTPPVPCPVSPWASTCLFWKMFPVPSPFCASCLPSH